MKQIYFIAGTDTDVGKTYCCALLLQAAQQCGYVCLPYKPVAAGCELDAGELKNPDALSLMAASHCSLPYSMINPYAFASPIAPHIAAKQLGVELKLDLIQQAYEGLQAHAPDLLLIEGAGGWHLPLSLASDKQKTVLLSDWVIQQQIPVILVVGMKLGCLNHALLTIAAIKSAGGILAGWIANQCEPNMLAYQENIQSLQQLIDEPLLAEIHYGEQDPCLFDGFIQAMFAK